MHVLLPYCLLSLPLALVSPGRSQDHILPDIGHPSIPAPVHSEAEISLAQRTGAHLLLSFGLLPSFLAQVPSWGCKDHVLPEGRLQNLPAAPSWLHRQLSAPPCLPSAACSFLLIAAHCGAHLHAQALVLHMLLFLRAFRFMICL